MVQCGWLGNKFSFPAPCHHLYKTHLQRLTSYFMHVAIAIRRPACSARSRPNCFQPLTSPPPPSASPFAFSQDHLLDRKRWRKGKYRRCNFLVENKFSIVNYQVSQGLIEQQWKWFSFPSFPHSPVTRHWEMSPGFPSRVPFREDRACTEPFPSCRMMCCILSIGD